MRKRIIAVQHEALPEDQDWLDLQELMEIEMTSEDQGHPIESALLAGEGEGWRAGEPGTQTLRFVFSEPRRIHKIRLVFVEPDTVRTQEYVLRWSKGAGLPFKDIVRQQWNFNPEGANTEIENYDVELPDIKVLELVINPDVNNANAVATLKRMQIA